MGIVAVSAADTNSLKCLVLKGERVRTSVNAATDADAVYLQFGADYV